IQLLGIEVIHRVLVTFLNEQPLVSLTSRPPRSHTRQHELPLELFPVQAELQVALLQHLRGIAERLPGSRVPHHHGAGAVVARRDDAFEQQVVHGMVLGHHGEALVGGIERRSLGHRPRLQHAFHLQAKIVVQMRRLMLLHHEAPPLGLCDLRRRLGSLLKSPLAAVFLEGHSCLDAGGPSCNWRLTRAGCLEYGCPAVCEIGQRSSSYDACMNRFARRGARFMRLSSECLLLMAFLPGAVKADQVLSLVSPTCTQGIDTSLRCSWSNSDGTCTYSPGPIYCSGSSGRSSCMWHCPPGVNTTSIYFFPQRRTQCGGSALLASNFFQGTNPDILFSLQQPSTSTLPASWQDTAIVNVNDISAAGSPVRLTGTVTFNENSAAGRRTTLLFCWDSRKDIRRQSDLSWGT